MKIIVLMDSYKGSLSSVEAGEAVKDGILDADGTTEVTVYPFADGGEGTLDAFLYSDRGSRKVRVQVSDPLGRKIEASYGILSDKTVVIEIAQSAGLCLLSEEERNPMKTTTRGIGQLIKHAIQNGHREFIIALGGSATNDCGLGMLTELGFEICDENMMPVEDGAQGLSRATSVITENVIPHLDECTFTIACDVKNPLFGETGASRIFAPQKGAKPSDVIKMDGWMADFSRIVCKTYPKADPLAEGAGAAGGLGFAFQTFLNGKMESGARVLLERTQIEKEISSADLVITGEGRMDEQTSMGKAPVMIAQVAKRYDKSVIAIAGCVAKGAAKCHEAGIDAIFPTICAPMSEKEAMTGEVARENVKRTACELMRLIVAK